MVVDEVDAGTAGVCGGGGMTTGSAGTGTRGVSGSASSIWSVIVESSVPVTVSNPVGCMDVGTPRGVGRSSCEYGQEGRDSVEFPGRAKDRTEGSNLLSVDCCWQDMLGRVAVLCAVTMNGRCCFS